MLLAIDVGNTNSKFAVFDGDRIVGAVPPAHRGQAHRRRVRRLADPAHAPAGLRSASRSTARSWRASCRAVNPNLRRLCETYFKPELLIVGEPDCELGIKVLIDRPQDAGADRLVGVIAGYKKYGGPLITVDFGSATTFDMADKDGNFVGGVLAPGVELTIESFYLMTARLPRIRVEKPAQVIGKATVPAMQSGIFWGYVGLIESLIKRIRAEYGEPMKVVATGGLANVFKDEIGLFDAIEPDLMSLGLLEIMAPQPQT